MAKPRPDRNHTDQPPSNPARPAAADKSRTGKGHASGPNGAGAYAEPGFERPKSKSTGQD